jgi:hypothetical protein
MQLFTRRDEVFDEFTDAILEELNEAKMAAAEMIGVDFKDRIKWSAVAVVDANTLVMAGEVQFEVGETIQDEEGLEITVTEEMLPALTRVVRIGVPFDMAETGTKQEILDYLKTFKETQKGESIEAIEGENTGIDTVADLAGEFRSAGLSQEQIASMLIFAEQSTGKVN